jgi:hypothetical protein
MTMTGLVCVIVGIAAVLAAICVVRVRLFLRRMNIWAEKMIRSFFGSPEELLRRLREQEARKAQHDSAKPADGENARPSVGCPHWVSAGEGQPQGAGPARGTELSTHALN